jgi:host factor-I protein
MLLLALDPVQFLLQFDNHIGRCQCHAGQKNRNNGTTTMPTERQASLQDTFLNHVRKAKIPLTIFLVNGVKLQGIVTWFDNFCVLLRRDGHSQLVYKHAISTIMPGQPVHLMDSDPADPS